MNEASQKLRASWSLFSPLLALQPLEIAGPAPHTTSKEHTFKIWLLAGCWWGMLHPMASSPQTHQRTVFLGTSLPRVVSESKYTILLPLLPQENSAFNQCKLRSDEINILNIPSRPSLHGQKTDQKLAIRFMLLKMRSIAINIAVPCHFLLEDASGIIFS